jgi:SAM-dependent methyltransferase
MSEETNLTGAESVACDLCAACDECEVYPARIRRSLADSDFTVFGERAEHARIVRCRRCGLRYASPRDASKGLLAKYEQLPLDGYLSDRDSRLVTARRDVRLLQKFVNGGPVLDVGCSAGLFLSCLPSAFDRYGIEPGQEGARLATAVAGEYRVHAGPLDSAPFERESFTAVTLWDVIEHLPSPRAALGQIHSFLRRGGFTFIVTPDINSSFARALGRRWPHLIRQHLFYFDRGTLGQLVTDSGLRIVRTATYTRYFTLSYLLARVGLIQRNRQASLTSIGLRIPVNVGDSLLMVAVKE